MKSIKKPHLDHTQALMSYVSRSLGSWHTQSVFSMG